MPILPGSTIGILGGGQLGRMTAMAARSYGYRVQVLDPDPSCPARFVVDACFEASWDDAHEAAALARGSDVVTLEIEQVAIASIHAAAKYAPVRPGAHLLEVIQDRLVQRAWLARHGFPVGDHRAVTTAAELASALADFGNDVFIKAARGGYDGRSQLRLTPKDRVDPRFSGKVDPGFSRGKQPLTPRRSLANSPANPSSSNAPSICNPNSPSSSPVAPPENPWCTPPPPTITNARFSNGRSSPRNYPKRSPAAPPRSPPPSPSSSPSKACSSSRCSSSSPENSSSTSSPPAPTTATIRVNAPASPVSSSSTSAPSATFPSVAEDHPPRRHRQPPRRSLAQLRGSNTRAPRQREGWESGT